MCGLFGVFGNVPSKREVVMDLAIANMARGTDSTGYADVFVNTNNFVIRKNALDAKKFAHQLKMTRGDLVIGHTRHATTGKICARNAHPWRIGKLIGAHNGILMNQFSVENYLKDVHGDNTKYEVDSQYLLHMMDRLGHMGNANGMLNLTYWDMATKQLVFIIHNNPMNLAIDIDMHWLIWSSDKTHLERVVAQNKLTNRVKMVSLASERLNIEWTNNTLTTQPDKVPFDLEHRKSWDDGYTPYYSNHNSHYKSNTSSSYSYAKHSQYEDNLDEDDCVYIRVNGVWVTQKSAKKLEEKETQSATALSTNYAWPSD